MKVKQTSFLVLLGIAMVALGGCGSKASKTETVTPQQAEQMKADQINKYKQMQQQGNKPPQAPATSR